MSYHRLKEFHNSIVSICKVCGMKCSCVREIEIIYCILIFDQRLILIYYSYIRWVTSKEIHECEVPKWKKAIAGIVCVFEKELPTSPFTYTPIWWHRIGGCCINEVDIFLWEVYENSKKISLTKGTSRGLHGWRVCIEWIIFLPIWIPW